MLRKTLFEGILREWMTFIFALDQQSLYWKPPVRQDVKVKNLTLGSVMLVENIVLDMENTVEQELFQVRNLTADAMRLKSIDTGKT